MWYIGSACGDCNYQDYAAYPPICFYAENYTDAIEKAKTLFEESHPSWALLDVEVDELDVLRFLPIAGGTE